MYSIDPSTLNEQENYKLLIGSILPRPIAFITSLSENGVLNGAPFSFFNIVSSNPPLISVAIQRTNGSMKDTARNILKQREFVVHITDTSNVKKINETAKALLPTESEVQMANLTPVKSKKVGVPGIQEAKIRMECTLETVLQLGGEGQNPGCELIIGKIVQYHIQKDVYSQGRIHHEKLGPVSRLAGSSYAEIGSVFSIKRPT
ncbi:flavin reductase family protein [Domibacillus sp. A3M-37]|uniref:flavin reductase family protein n=1 Tax=Domibacillus TaxID=1433999 RepID=UPI0006183164|nr:MULTISPECIES: flavin reductase family protein [Domibacillus]MCP3762971.1 flavin reductase family protein [Domibacillus sp. A3M-37]